MAKFLIEVEDAPGGEMTFRLEIDKMPPDPTGLQNTPAQNVAVYLSRQLSELGFKVPIL